MINPAKRQRLLSPLTLPFIFPFTLPPYLGRHILFPFVFPFVSHLHHLKGSYWLSVSSHYCPLTLPPCLSVSARSDLSLLSPPPPLAFFSLHPDFTFLLFFLLILSPHLHWYPTILAADTFISHHYPTVCHLRLTADSSVVFRAGENENINPDELRPFPFCDYLSWWERKGVANLKMSSRLIFLWPCSVWAAVYVCVCFGVCKISVFRFF